VKTEPLTDAEKVYLSEVLWTAHNHSDRAMACKFLDEPGGEGWFRGRAFRLRETVYDRVGARRERIWF
jgi:hypothetical protein